MTTTAHRRQVRGDGLHHAPESGEIGRSVIALRRSDGDEHAICRGDRLLTFGRESQSASLGVSYDQFRKARFVDRNVAVTQSGDLIGIDVDTDDVVARFGEAGPRDETDVAGANHGDLHINLSQGRVPVAGPRRRQRASADEESRRAWSVDSTEFLDSTELLPRCLAARQLDRKPDSTNAM